MTEALKNSQFAYDLLAIAHQDLKAARLLYDGGCYPQAIFYLEQSAEKGLKSYSIASGLIDEKEAWRGISHKTLKIYEKTWKDLRQWSVNLEDKIKKNPILEKTIGPRMHFPEIINDFDHDIGKIKTLLSQDEKSLNLSETELKKHIKNLQDIYREINKIKTDSLMKPVSHSKYREIKRDLTAIFKDRFADQPERLQVVKEKFDRDFTFEKYEKEKKKKMEQIINEILPHNEIFQSFFELSIVLQPHAVARYPKIGFNPIEFYTPYLPLVKSFPKLADITERVLNQVDESYQKSAGVLHVPSI